jgi:hypothetical protein
MKASSMGIATQLLRCCGASNYVCFDHVPNSVLIALRHKGVQALTFGEANLNPGIHNVFVYSYRDVGQEGNLMKAFEMPLFTNVSYIAFIESGAITDGLPIIFGTAAYDRMINAGFHIHPKSALLASDKYQGSVVFVRSELPENAFCLHREDIFRQRFQSGYFHLKMVRTCFRYVIDYSTTIISGKFVGALGYSLRTETLSETIVEVHQDASSRDYFNAFYPTVPNQRTTVKEIDIDRYMGTASLCIHVVSTSLSEELPIIDKLILCLSMGARLVVIVCADSPDQDKLSKKMIRQYLHLAFGDRLKIDFVKSVKTGMPYTLCFAIKTMNLNTKVLAGSQPMGLSHPWISHSMISLGRRFSNSNVLEHHALEVLVASERLSAQEGAALCVVIYRYMDYVKLDRDLPPSASNIFTHAEYYLNNAPSKDRSTLRWLISMSYAYASFLHISGNFIKAEKYYLQCITLDPLMVNPQMSSKTLLSYICLGRYSLVRRDKRQAKQRFQEGLMLARRAIGGDWQTLMGNDAERPHRFGMPELGNVINLGANCADALNVLSLEYVDLGLIWSIIEGLH